MRASARVIYIISFVNSSGVVSRVDELATTTYCRRTDVRDICAVAWDWGGALYVFRAIDVFEALRHSVESNVDSWSVVH